MARIKFETLLNEVQDFGRHNLEQRLTHQKQDEVYDQMVRLQTARERVLDLLSPEQPMLPHLEYALQIMHRRSQIYQLFNARELALSNSGLSVFEQRNHGQELWQEREDHLAQLPEMPELSLSEQERVLQELMRQAVELYVDQSLEQMKIHFHFDAA